MLRRSFLLVLPAAVAFLQACYNAKDSRLFLDAGVTRVLLAADQRVQQLAEQEILRPLRDRLSSRVSDADIGFVCLNNENGDVLAYIPTFRDDTEFDNCRAENRDVGSVAKPFAYGIALQTKAVSAVDTFLDNPMEFSRLDGPGTFRARNYGDSYTGDWMTLVEALAISSNSVALQVYRRIDQQKLRELLAGFNLPLTYNVNLMPLGRWAVSPLMLASAYTVFPNGGRAVAPRFITAREYPDGRREEFPVVRTAQLFREEVCSIVSDGMRQCLTRGTGASAAADLGEHWARGKTGSSQDAWSVLQSKRITSVIWIGNKKTNSDLKMTGGHIAMPYLAKFFRALRREQPEWIPPWE